MIRSRILGSATRNFRVILSSRWSLRLDSPYVDKTEQGPAKRCSTYSCCQKQTFLILAIAIVARYMIAGLTPECHSLRLVHLSNQGVDILLSISSISTFDEMFELALRTCQSVYLQHMEMASYVSGIHQLD